MTVDSIPMSGLGRTGRWFYGSAQWITTAYAATASPAKFSSFAFIFI